MTVRKRLPIRTVDVFTNRPLTGNPLAVLLGADVLDDEDMQRIAAEMNLPETAFVLPPTNPEAHYRIRIFTPISEMPFAGHPAIGTAFVLAEEGILQVGREKATFKQELGIGILPLEIYSSDGRPSRVVMTQGEPRPGEYYGGAELSGLLDALGLGREHLRADLPARAFSTGLESLLLPLASREALSGIRPDAERLHALPRIRDLSGIYVFVLSEGNAYARFFAPTLGITEDPVTGSAAGALGAYLFSQGALPIEEGRSNLKVYQGQEIGRPGEVGVEVVARDDSCEVRVSGRAVTVLRGDVWI